MSPSSPAVSALPWLVAAWIVTVVVVSVLIYLIAREVLARPIRRVCRSSARPHAATQWSRPGTGELRSFARQTMSCQSGQTGNTAVEPGEEAS